MNDSQKNPFEPFFEEIRKIIREEIGVLRAETASIENKDWLNANELARLHGFPRYVLFNRRDVEGYLERHKQKNGGDA